MGEADGQLGRCSLHVPVRRRAAARATAPKRAAYTQLTSAASGFATSLAWATGTLLLGIGALLVGDLDRTSALLNVAALWSLILAIDFVVSFSYTLRPRTSDRGMPSTTDVL